MFSATPWISVSQSGLGLEYFKVCCQLLVVTSHKPAGIQRNTLGRVNICVSITADCESSIFCANVTYMRTANQEV